MTAWRAAGSGPLAASVLPTASRRGDLPVACPFGGVQGAQPLEGQAERRDGSAGPDGQDHADDAEDQALLGGRGRLGRTADQECHPGGGDDDQDDQALAGADRRGDDDDRDVQGRQGHALRVGGGVGPDRHEADGQHQAHEGPAVDRRDAVDRQHAGRIARGRDAQRQPDPLSPTWATR